MSSLGWRIKIQPTPLMPCCEAKARHLLKEHRAVIVNRTPFTIRLKFVVDDITQPVTLGVDAGYETIGLFRKPDGTKVSAGMSYRKLEPVQHSGSFTFTQLLPLGKPRGFR